MRPSQLRTITIQRVYPVVNDFFRVLYQFENARASNLVRSSDRAVLAVSCTSGQKEKPLSVPAACLADLCRCPNPYMASLGIGFTGDYAIWQGNQGNAGLGERKDM